MASSDSRGNNVDQEEEEEEVEYEEIEEEVEEEEEEEFEEIEEEIEEEVEEEIEEEVEEEEFEEEEVEEEEVEEEEEEEEPEEEVEEEEEEEEVEYEEVEIEVEEEVTDEEEGGGEGGDATMAEVEGDDSALVAVKSDSPVPLVAENEDGSLDVKSKTEVCSRSGHTSAMKSGASIVTEIRASETFCPGGGSSSRELQDGDGKFSDGKSRDEVCLRPEHTSLSRELRNGDGTEISSFIGSSVSPKMLEHVPGPSNDGSDSVKDNQVNEDRTTLVSTSEKHVSAPDDVTEQSARTIDAEESKSLSDEADLQVSPRRNKEKTESRSCLSQVRPRSLLSGGECEDSNKRPAISCEFFARGWCIKGSSCRFLHKSNHAIVTQVEGDKGSGHDVDASELRRHEDMDKTPLLERKSSSSRVSVELPKSSYKDHARSISTPRDVEADIFKENHSSDSHVLPGTRHGSLLRDFGISPGSDSISRLVEESAAMRRRYSLGIQNSLPSYRMSSYASYAQIPQTSINYKMFFTPYNWEPSIPFQSSFIPPVNRSSNVQYDPFRDSMEEPDAECASFKQSSYGQSQNVQSFSGQNPLEFQKRVLIDNWDKSYSGNDKVVPAFGSESAATSGSDAQNRIMTEEENPVVPGSVKDILKANKGNYDGNLKLHSSLKVEKGRQPNELDDEESKAIRLFRVTLIEFVKELMKPIWHEGRLSKDVYKVIVQKAEDKILSTLQPSEVPNTSDSVQQYLSSSRPKILKLIQAYVDKYGKF